MIQLKHGGLRSLTWQITCITVTEGELKHV